MKPCELCNLEPSIALVMSGEEEFYIGRQCISRPPFNIVFGDSKKCPQCRKDTIAQISEKRGCYHCVARDNCRNFNLIPSSEKPCHWCPRCAIRFKTGFLKQIIIPADLNWIERW